MRTGSAVSILPYDIFLAKFRDKKLQKTSTVLREAGKPAGYICRVFEDKLGTFKFAKAKIILKEGSQPQFHKAHQVPYSLQPKVEEQLKRFESEGILSKVEWNDWATPIVPVPKQDGSSLDFW